MIPKTINYIWLGKNPLPPTIKKCIASWEKILPEYEIKCWDESNLNITDPTYLKTLAEKKWAFASDIARLHVLYNHGGIYLDTDMEVVKSLNPLLDTDMFIGLEDEKHIAAGIIGCTAKNAFIKDSLEAVTRSLSTDTIPIPQVMTKVYDTRKDKYTFNHKIYSKEFFYPYNPFASEIKILFYSDVVENTYAIHHWGHSWKMGVIEKILKKTKRLLKNALSKKTAV